MAAIAKKSKIAQQIIAAEQNIKTIVKEMSR